MALNSIVVMDNASIHHVQGVLPLIKDQAQAKVIFLPPYSPDLNQAKQVFSKVKKPMVCCYKFAVSLGAYFIGNEIQYVIKRRL